MSASEAVSGRRSAWIPWAFVGFFGVVLITNAAMIWLAFQSWTGLATEDAYQKGLAYNQAIARADAQAALGWRVDLAVAARPGRTLEIALTLADRHGDLIEDAAIRADVVRPTHAGHDRTIPVAHRYGGDYAARATLPLAGLWDVRLTIAARGEVWRAGRRVHLRP